MKYLIYKITNTLNSKSYIGITGKSLEERWKTHRQGQRRYSENKEQGWHPNGTCVALYEAMRTDGIENFTIELLETCEVDDIRMVYRREQFHIKAFNTAIPHGYNLNVRKLTEEQVAIVRFNAYNLSPKEYASLFNVSISVIFLARRSHLQKDSQYVSGDPYWYITRDYLPEEFRNSPQTDKDDNLS